MLCFFLSYEKKNGHKLEIRDYQLDAALNCIKKKIGIIAHATGAGKSLTIAFIIGFLLAKRLINRCTIIVPRQLLVTQFKNDLIDLFNKGLFIVF